MNPHLAVVVVGAVFGIIGAVAYFFKDHQQTHQQHQPHHSRSSSRPTRREAPEIEECSICLDYVYRDARNCVQLQCTHLIHKECHEECIQAGSNRCPVCRERF